MYKQQPSAPVPNAAVTYAIPQMMLPPSSSSSSSSCALLPQDAFPRPTHVYVRPTMRCDYDDNSKTPRWNYYSLRIVQCVIIALLAAFVSTCVVAAIIIFMHDPSPPPQPSPPYRAPRADRDAAVRMVLGVRRSGKNGHGSERTVDCTLGSTAALRLGDVRVVPLERLDGGARPRAADVFGSTLECYFGAHIHAANDGGSAGSDEGVLAALPRSACVTAGCACVGATAAGDSPERWAVLSVDLDGVRWATAAAFAISVDDAYRQQATVVLETATLAVVANATSVAATPEAAIGVQALLLPNVCYLAWTPSLSPLQ